MQSRTFIAFLALAFAVISAASPVATPLAVNGKSSRILTNERETKAFERNRL